MATGITEQLAIHTAKVRYEDIPPEAIEKAKDCILDQIGVELIGSTLEWNKIAYRYVAEMGGRGESTVVNYGNKVPTLDAAFVNATFGQGCELDDVGFAAGGHPSAATVPVALAVGEKQRNTGEDFLAAVVVGCDVMYRLLAAVRPSSGKRGFHSHGIGAPFGAMATAARLLRLNDGQMLHAFGIAGMHSSGTMEYDQTGGEVKRVIAGVAARGGIQSALLAQLGLTGPPTIIEGKRGFLKVFADQVEPDEITRDLGSDFKIMRVWFKLYPCVATDQTHRRTPLRRGRCRGDPRRHIRNFAFPRRRHLRAPRCCERAVQPAVFSRDPLVEKRQRSELLHGSEAVDRSESSRTCQESEELRRPEREEGPELQHDDGGEAY